MEEIVVEKTFNNDAVKANISFTTNMRIFVKNTKSSLNFSRLLANSQERVCDSRRWLKFGG